MARPSRVAVAILGGLAVAAISGCDAIPMDPDGALDRIRSTGEIRAGASPAAGLVVTDDGDPAGPLPRVVEDYAASLGADVVWTVGSEEELVDELERGALDLAVGGMTDQSPWTDRAAVTRGFPELSPSGEDPVVVLCRLGENGMLVSLERFLDETVGS